MMSDEMSKKLNGLPHGTVMYIYYNGEFLPIDCIRHNREDGEAYIIPIKEAEPAPPIPPRQPSSENSILKV